MYIKQVRVWMAVTPDEYELPIALADSSRELAERMGTTVSAIVNRISRERRGAQPEGYRVRKVILDDHTE